MSDLIDKRDERTRRRKKVKRKMDSIIGLSYHDKDKRVMSVSMEAKKLSDDKARLIDEGYIDNGFVIKKGAMEKYLNGQNQYVRGWEFDGEHWTQTEVLNLNDDFEGHVNLGHIDFATFPYILGHFDRNDLSLVEIENDRHALDVQLHLDEESVFIKELRRQPFDIGISAEFWVHENVEDTEALSETLGYYLPVFDEIYIFAYGLVGECGNVNSSGLELNTKETEMPNEKMNIEELELGIDAEEEEEVAEEPTELEVDVEVEAIETEVVLDAEDEVEIPPTEDTEEAPQEEPTEEDAEESEEEIEEAEVEEVTEDDESDDDEDDSDEDDPLTETLASLQKQIETLTNTVNELTEQNVALKKTNRKLSNKLQTEKNKKDEFIKNVKGLSVQLLPDEEKKKEEPKKESVNRAYYNGDGIGEL